MIITYQSGGLVLGRENNPDLINKITSLGWTFKQSVGVYEAILPENWKHKDNWRTDMPDHEKYMRFEGPIGASVTARPFSSETRSIVEISAFFKEIAEADIERLKLLDFSVNEARAGHEIKPPQDATLSLQSSSLRVFKDGVLLCDFLEASPGKPKVTYFPHARDILVQRKYDVDSPEFLEAYYVPGGA